jgi:parallel beta-helix repeat protein
MFDYLGNQLNQATYVNGGLALTQAGIAAALFPQTATEQTAGVTPTAYQYAQGNVFRYGALGNNVANDVSAFNQAVSVASVAGGSVYVPGGFTYALSTNVNVAASNVRIYGDGLGSILNFTGTSRLGGLSFVGTQGAHITGCMVENLQVVGAGNGVSTGTGVFGHYCDNFKILSVTAYNWSDNAFGCGDSASPDGSNNIQISNCVGYNVSQGISCFYPSRNVIITGNTFYNITLYDGIDVEGTNGATSGTATSGSTTTIVDTTKTWAVNQFQGLAGTVTISGTLYAIYVESNTATTLTIAPIAVSVVASDAYQVFANSFTVIANNVVYNMTGSGSAGPTHGINVELNPYASITGNVVYQATNGSGIHLFGSPYSTVSGNTCFSNGQPLGGTYSSGFGIYIGANCGNCTVVGNTTNGNAFGSCKLTDDATAASYNVLINDNNFNEGVIVQSGNVSLVSPYGATIKNKNTFTPTVTGISGGTYSIQTGEYTLIDNLVTFTLNVGYSGATSTGSIGISGLPFTSTASNVTAMSVRANGLPITTGSQLMASVNQSATAVAISQWLESSGALSAVTAPTSLTQLTISGTYPTS